MIAINRTLHKTAECLACQSKINLAEIQIGKQMSLKIVLCEKCLDELFTTLRNSKI